MRLAYAPAVVNHSIAHLPGRVAGLGHHARAVNACHHGPKAHDWALVGDGQAILVVQGGVRHRHVHIARRQKRFIQLLDRGAESFGVFQ